MNNLTQESIDAIVVEASLRGYQISYEGDNIVLIYTAIGESPYRTHLKLQIGEPIMLYVNGGYVPLQEQLDSLLNTMTNIANGVSVALKEFAIGVQPIVHKMGDALLNFYRNIPDEIKEKYSKGE